MDDVHSEAFCTTFCEPLGVMGGAGAPALGQLVLPLERRRCVRQKVSREYDICNDIVVCLMCLEKVHADCDR